MWKTFGSSIGLLSLAMTAALYSSGVAREGRLAAAAISATIALAIAVWVGFRFVPRLAANVDWDWLPFFSRYELTREGVIYFVAVTVVLFAAVNTSNNLLYMVLAALLAVLILSGFLSALNFRFVNVSVRVPSRVFAGEPFPISMNVRNEKRMFPSFSLQVEPVDAGTFRFPSFYIPAIRAQANVFKSGEAMLARRGQYVMREIRFRSRYPFGFFVKAKACPVRAECICYPEILSQERMNLSVRDLQGSTQRLERGFGNDLHTIRDYLPSDGARHVHWKASAKTATLKTREYATEESQRVVLAFDRFGHDGDADNFERLVSYAASIVYHLINDGIEVAFVSDDWRSGTGNSQALLDSILQYLALVTMSVRTTSASINAPEGAVVLSLRNL